MGNIAHIYYPEIKKNGILIDRGDILRLLGNQEDAIDAHSEGLVSQFITECIRVSSPKGAYLLADALENDSANQLTIPGLLFQSGPIIRKMLRHSEKYALYMVTAGPEPENMVRALMGKGNYLEGYIADLVNSALVESIADQLEVQVRSQAAGLGWEITNRYSPGYCSWDVEEQQKLFSLFPENCCGISLSPSSLMSPIKSTTGIIGLGKKVVYRDYICEICSMKNCHFRKVRIS